MSIDEPRPRSVNDLGDQRAQDRSRYAADFRNLLAQVRHSQAEQAVDHVISEDNPRSEDTASPPAREHPLRTQPRKQNLTVRRSRTRPSEASSVRGSSGHLALNLFVDLLIVIMWPPILIAPVAFLGQFGYEPSIFLGSFDENMTKLTPPFAATALITAASAWAVDIRRYMKGSDNRALRGWGFLPPVCILAGTIAIIPFAIVTGILSPLLPFLNFPQRMPLSNFMFWTSGMTPAILLLWSGFSSKGKDDESVAIWDALPTIVIVFLLSILIS